MQLIEFPLGRLVQYSKQLNVVSLANWCNRASKTMDPLPIVYSLLIYDTECLLFLFFFHGAGDSRDR